MEDNIDIMEQPEQKIKVRPEAKPQVEPQYVVVIGDSIKHTFEFVVEVCVAFCAMTEQQAQLTAKAIHTEGQAPVYRGSWDATHLVRDQIRSKGGDAHAERMGIKSDTAIPCWVEEG